MYTRRSNGDRKEDLITQWDVHVTTTATLNGFIFQECFSACVFCFYYVNHVVITFKRITFKLAVIVYRALHGTAPRYLSDQLHRVADMPSRSRLRSASSNRLDIRPSRLVTVGDHSYASAGPRVGNSLPEDVTSAPSLPVFRRKLKDSPVLALVPRHCYCVIVVPWSFFNYRPL